MLWQARGATWRHAQRVQPAAWLEAPRGSAQPAVAPGGLRPRRRAGEGLHSPCARAPSPRPTTARRAPRGRVAALVAPAPPPMGHSLSDPPPTVPPYRSEPCPTFARVPLLPPQDVEAERPRVLQGHQQPGVRLTHPPSRVARPRGRWGRGTRARRARDLAPCPDLCARASRPPPTADATALKPPPPQQLLRAPRGWGGPRRQLLLLQPERLGAGWGARAAVRPSKFVRRRAMLPCAPAILTRDHTTPSPDPPPLPMHEPSPSNFSTTTKTPTARPTRDSQMATAATTRRLASRRAATARPSPSDAETSLSARRPAAAC